MDITFKELTQLDIEKFDEGMPTTFSVRQAIYYGAAVRNAIKAGWIINPSIKLGEVDGMKPGRVFTLGKKIIAEYERVTKIDPE